MVHGHYVNFVMNALCAQGPHIDNYYRQNEKHIRASAKAARKRFPVAIVPLYRGILLDPSEHNGHTLQHKPEHVGLSFSEDKKIALEFADTKSEMSGALMERCPTLQGFLIEHTPKPEEILYHHSWLEPLGLFRYLSISPIEYKILMAQKEVILLQQGHDFPLIPIKKV